jgi:hypothetical protein
MKRLAAVSRYLRLAACKTRKGKRVTQWPDLARYLKTFQHARDRSICTREDAFGFLEPALSAASSKRRSILVISLQDITRDDPFILSINSRAK